MRLARGTREVFDAEALLAAYVRPGKRVRYAYPSYDGLVTNGDPKTLVSGDLLAPSLLGAPVDIRRMTTLTALLPLLQRALDTLPLGVALADADDSLCDRIAACYDPLDDPDVPDRDVKGSLLAKVLHRKRPELLPLYDSRVLAFYRHEDCVPPAPRGSRTWREYMQLLVPAIRDDLRAHRGDFARLAQQVPEQGPTLSPLRVLDILVWMSEEP